MHSHLLYIVFSILYLSINVRGETTIVPTEATVVVQDTTVVEVAESSTVSETTEIVSTVDETTQAQPVVVSTSTIIRKLLTDVPFEPPVHPRGYCIRSDLQCSSIRRCCNGPCDLIKLKCP